MAGDTGAESLNRRHITGRGQYLQSTAGQPTGPFSSFWFCSALDTFDLLLVFNLYLIVLFLVCLFVCFYLFLAVLGLRCCSRAFSSCRERGLLFIAVCGLLIAVASLVAEHGL